jgi:hypothetical protein
MNSIGPYRYSFYQHIRFPAPGSPASLARKELTCLEQHWQYFDEERNLAPGASTVQMTPSPGNQPASAVPDDKNNLSARPAADKG